MSLASDLRTQMDYRGRASLSAAVGFAAIVLSLTPAAQQIPTDGKSWTGHAPKGVRDPNLPPDEDAAKEQLARSTLKSEWVDIKMADGQTIKTFIVHPVLTTLRPRGGVVIVVHDDLGLTDWVRGVAVLSDAELSRSTFPKIAGSARSKSVRATARSRITRCIFTTRRRRAGSVAGSSTCSPCGPSARRRRSTRRAWAAGCARVSSSGPTCTITRTASRQIDQTRVGLYWGKGELKKEVASALAGNLDLSRSRRREEPRAACGLRRRSRHQGRVVLPAHALARQGHDDDGDVSRRRSETLLNVPATTSTGSCSTTRRNGSRCRAARASTSWRTTTTRRTTRTTRIPIAR